MAGVSQVLSGTVRYCQVLAPCRAGQVAGTARGGDWQGRPAGQSSVVQQSGRQLQLTA